MHSKKYFLIFCFVFSFYALFSQNYVLTKIHKPGSLYASYLFLTIENKDIPEYDIISPLQQIFPLVNMVAFDFYLDGEQRLNMFDIMQFQGDQSLKKTYNRDDNIRYEIMVENKLKTDLQKLINTEPLYLMDLFKNVDHGMGVGYQNELIYLSAINKTKPIVSVLDIRQLEKIYFAVNFDTQAAVLSNYINNAEKFLAADEKSFNFYLNGDADAAVQSVNMLQLEDYFTSVQSVKNHLVFDAFLKMAEEKNNLFIADIFSAGGTDGILQLFKNEGYEIEPVYALLKKNNQLNADEIQDTEPDNFPELRMQNISNVAPDVSAFHLDSISQFHTPKYSALYDPFADMFDYVDADTAFLKDWFSIVSPDGSCRIRMPVKSDWIVNESETVNGKIKSSSYSGNHAKSDLFYSFGYTVYPEGFQNQVKADFFNDFVSRQVFKLKGELLNQRIISTPDYVGREFTIVVSDSFFVRSKLILKGTSLYQILCGGPDNNAFTENAFAFFQSFQIEDGPARNWSFYENTSFSCNMPTTPFISNQSINIKDGQLNIQTFASEDYQQGISYLISVYQYPASTNFGNENNYYDDLIAGAEKQYAGKAIVNEKVKRNGKNARYAEILLNNNKIYKVYFIIQDQTVYQYLAGGTQTAMSSKDPQYFFDTFTLKAIAK